MGKTRGVEARRARRNGGASGVRRGHQQGLHGVPSQDGRVLHRREDGRPKKTSTRQPDGRTNWLVRLEEGEVVAIEPNREYEHTFTGGSDPFWDAVKFAASCLRKEMA